MQKLATSSVLALAAGALVLTGCSSEKTGTGLPLAGASPAGSASAQPSPTASGGGVGTAIEPCSMLSATDLVSYGSFEAPKEQNIAGVRSCRLTRQLTNAGDQTLLVDVIVRETRSVDSMNDVGGAKTPGTVNGRRAVQVPTPPTACTMALAVGDTSRVDIQVVNIDPAHACDIASKLADIVEPKLPKG